MHPTLVQELADTVSQSETDLVDLGEQLERLEEALNLKTGELEEVKRHTDRQTGELDELRRELSISQAQSTGVSAGVVVEAVQTLHPTHSDNTHSTVSTDLWLIFVHI